MKDKQQAAIRGSDPWRSEPATRNEVLARATGNEADCEHASDPAQAQDGPSGSELAFEFVTQLAADLSSGELDLPSLPGIVMRIKSVLEDENSTAETIARLMGSEPALAARLLAMANSAAFRRGGVEVTDLKSAVSRLGRDLIRTSALSYALKNLMDAQTVAQVRGRLTALWRHSIMVAAMANTIGKRTETVNADEAMFIGLMHDVGKLYILSRIGGHPELFACPDAVSQIMSEWHEQIGKAIVESWELPEHVASVVSDHENVERHKYGAADTLDVIIVANLLANARESGGFDELDFETVSAFARLRIDPSCIDEFFAESREELDELMNVLRG